MGALALLVACGDNLYGPVDLAAEYNAAHCRWLVRCGLVADDTQCALAFEPWQLRGDLAAAHELGSVVMDVDAARRCVRDTEARSCEWTSSRYRVLTCWNLFVGTLPDGTTCGLSDECVSQECWFDDDCDDACCIGTCIGDVPPVAGLVGEPCRFSVCREGWCDGSTCQPSLAEGDACQWAGSCADGLTCTLGRCRRLPRSGEPCDSQCAAVADVCRDYRCQRAGTLDAACSFDGDCTASFECHDGRCAWPRPAALGEDCFWKACEDGAYCSRDIYECVPLLADEAPCLFDFECTSGSCGDDGQCWSGTCTAFGAS